MSDYKFLIDTNIVIGLEDARPVEDLFAQFQLLCLQYKVGLFVEEANFEDIERDRDNVRRAITLSKLRKFPRLARAPMDFNTLVRSFGPLASANDVCDARLLAALDRCAVDFLVSEDAGLRRRAERAGLAGRVMSLAESVDWLRQTFTEEAVELPHIVSRKAYELDVAEPFFDSLRNDYAGFDKWFDEKCCKKHRDCWVLDVDGKIAGLLIRKDESRADAGTSCVGDRILKICTFKIGDSYRGEKFGELLLKQCLWFAARNAYEVIYTTVYPQHESLRALLCSYGFNETETLTTGEIRVERSIMPARSTDAETPLEFARNWYPHFKDDSRVRKFCVPIQAQYHTRLFPEIAVVRESPLFPEEIFGKTFSGFQGKDRTPGNTIKKVYLCRSKNSKLRPGDLLLFYMSKNESYFASQTITTLGVVDSLNIATSTDDLLRLTAKRSVYSKSELESWDATPEKPVRVIDFLLMKHFDPAVSLNTLLRVSAFNSRPPQSIAELSHESYLQFGHNGGNQ